MRQLLQLFATGVYLIAIGVLLIIAHPIFWLLLRLRHTTAGAKLHHRAGTLCAWLIMKTLRIVGGRFEIIGSANVPPPDSGPIILISNHQSLFDIPLLICAFSEWCCHFVAKKELGRGIPSISLQLREGGSALVDRKDSDQALSEIRALGERNITQAGSAIAIFPEGTRSATGVPRKFKFGGVLALLEVLPNATIVPVVINRSWELFRYRLKPIPSGVVVSCEILPAIKSDGVGPVKTVEEVERRVLERLPHR